MKREYYNRHKWNSDDYIGILSKPILLQTEK
jgi:hypothetical protein